MKITVDGSADIGWTVEIFAVASDPVSVWSGHPDAATEADAVRAALAEWEHPTQQQEAREASEAARLNQQAIAFAVRQAEAQAAAEEAAAIAVQQQQANAMAAAVQMEAEAQQRIANEDAAARERNAAEGTA